jgi:hypothetical protein
LKKQRRGSNLADKALGIDCREDLCEVFISRPAVLGVENRIADAGVAVAKWRSGKRLVPIGTPVTFRELFDCGPEKGHALRQHRFRKLAGTADRK